MIKVCILMSTYNGEKHIGEQLESILTQSVKDIMLFIRDDGSTDNTIKILNEFSKKNPAKIKFYQGDNIGPSKSFLELVKRAPKASYYMLADQDDIWLENKVFIAIKSLDRFKSPALYYSNVTPVNNQLVALEKNDLFLKKETNLQKLVIRNEIIGCTVCFNQLLMDNLKQIKSPTNTIMHDHWIGLINAVVKGTFIFDKESYILYRQHEFNVVGSHRNPLTLLKKHFSKHNRSVRSNLIKLINESRLEIPLANIALIDDICNYTTNFKSKMNLLFNKSLYQDSLLKNILWFIDVLINRY
ncbi:MAG: glycosyltransferase family 2 protein [Enterococcus sp.]|uniref:glycosyltransferase family 2 protein n=1 Tax=Enterococcus TaxID=1350 RepID=UPI0028919A48|nr:glycosyltransferase family 2 protein [Enterococcus gallinarum]MDT2684968.1 glycosyltransferase family 2 protein [Enterococcus gallinarum]